MIANKISKGKKKALRKSFSPEKNMAEGFPSICFAFQKDGYENE